MYQAAEARIGTLRIVNELRPFVPQLQLSIQFDKERREGETHLIVSEGVTAKTASIIPAPSPASRLRGGETLPSPTHAHVSLLPPYSGLTRAAATHLSVRERVLEVVVGHEAHARLHGVACRIEQQQRYDLLHALKEAGNAPMTSAMHPE